MLEFKLEEFDFNFLWDMVDNGFEVSKYSYESSLEDNILTGRFGEYYFHFELAKNTELNVEAEWEKVCAKRAVFVIRNSLRNWERANEHKYILEWIKNKYPDA